MADRSPHRRPNGDRMRLRIVPDADAPLLSPQNQSKNVTVGPDGLLGVAYVLSARRSQWSLVIGASAVLLGRTRGGVARVVS